MLRFGPASGPVVMIAAPLFEEANRTRALLVAICRGLAERGLASALPDLPGTGESLIETRDARLADWREAFAAAADVAGSRVLVLALRGGALIEAEAAAVARCHISPIDGAALVRDLIRTRLAAARESGEAFDPAAIAPPGPPIALAGNTLSRALLAELLAALPTRAERTVRLSSDPLPADLKLNSAPLWRRAEPGQDLGFAHRIADDITEWAATCGS